MADRRDWTESTGLLWEQAQRQLSQQGTDLDTLRTRALAMMSVAAVAAALFASRLPRAHLSLTEAIAVIVALVFFAAAVVLAIDIVMPLKRAWYFTYPLGQLAREIQAGTARTMDVAISLTRCAEESRERNSGQLERLYTEFWIVCLLVGLQIVAWAIAVLI